MRDETVTLRTASSRDTDVIVRVLAEYALGVDAALPAATRDEVRRKVIDVVACAFGAFDEPAVHAVRRYVVSHHHVGPALIWGTDLRVATPLAAIANGTATRCLDYNDGYQGARGDAGGHPSDVVPCLLAVAEEAGASGGDAALAIAIAYEVMVCLADAWRVKKRGVLDHVNAQALGAICGAARLLRLSQEELEEALAISAVAHVGLWQARKNQVRMWKSIAAGNAMRNAIECCYLARAGVQGPSRPFEGSAGLLHAAGDEDGIWWDAVESLVQKQPPTKIRDTNMKCWPVGQVGQTSVDVAVELHAQIGDFDAIREIAISTFESAARSMCRDDNWHPVTRETADHSLPYATVAGLYDGGITRDTFLEARLEEGTVQRLLDSIVRVDVLDEFTAQYPDAQPARIEVVMDDGRRLSAEARYPRGHARNPNRVGDAEYEKKFRDLVTPVLGPRTDEVLAALTAFESWRLVSEHLDMLRLGA
jgi:2-methylcitrate dehydratase